MGMIKVNFGLLIVLITTLLGCDLYFGGKRVFVIENQSSYPLLIEEYIKNVKQQHINIASKDFYSRTFKGGGNVYSPFNYEKVDSFVIIFDNKKFLYQACNGVSLINVLANKECYFEKNLTDFNFGKSSSRGATITYTHTFDDTDYAKAQDIPKE